MSKKLEDLGADAKKRLDNLMNKDRVKNQQQFEEQQSHNQQKYKESHNQTKSSSGGGNNKEKLFDTLNVKKNVDGAYKVAENLSDFFKNRPIDSNANSPSPKFQINEFYRGFLKMSGYAWGIALTFGLISFAVYRTFTPKQYVPPSELTSTAATTSSSVPQSITTTNKSNNDSMKSVLPLTPNKSSSAPVSVPLSLSSSSSSSSSTDNSKTSSKYTAIVTEASKK
ncbi:hypothetical protein PPL_00599 [Heterostelium album PN500]|uniref:Uncharacterized protein n=1 Tax=Heterostelium pallidum (strain ATCC 26659 / Pp 5 / PN500) TaxID=670386 RepID=D3AWX1_HETP5|nr:hypothetical protein PPL_00599 [Heterostelium album PN500]EFA86794.1 hypothetical protein PPL_00599 [Heterostelium album PN500]|eukprot:XP_020438898.1 hypothetical protein PPL_00599 [Heterostelium album PN500]